MAASVLNSQRAIDMSIYVVRAFIKLREGAAIHAEFGGKLRVIERRLGRAVRCLAYPYGGSSPRLRQMAASHYAIGVGTTLGFLAPRSDIMDLPRIDTYYLRGKSALARLFSEAGPPYILSRRVLREARRFLLDR